VVGVARIKVKLFTTLREVTGTKETKISAENVSAVLDQLTARFGRKFVDAVYDPQTGGLRPYYRILVNGRGIDSKADLEKALREGDVVAIFPPVGGG